MKLLLQYPTRSRPEIFKSTLKKYQKMLSKKREVSFHIQCDADDQTMNNAEMIKFLDAQTDLTYHFGNSKTKIEACNANIPLTGWDVIALISDDQIPKQKNFDMIILDAMAQHYPDTGGCLWFDDGVHGRDKLCTLSIVGNKYYNDHEHFFYDERFESLWCDNWFQYLAQYREKITYIPRVIISHDWIKITGEDQLHVRNSKGGQFERDHLTYDRLVKEFLESLTPAPIATPANDSGITLSICTLTIEGRKVLLDRLKAILEPQLTPQVEWLIDDTPPPASIGAKRQNLLIKAKGTYVCVIDDDDSVSTDYVARILEAAKENSDCIGFRGIAYKDGNVDRPFVASSSYDRWQNTPGLYQRTIYHISPVKRELALQIGFKPLNFNEDGDYSNRLRPLLKTETYIDADVYFYHYRTNISTCNNLNNRHKQVKESDLQTPKFPVRGARPHNPHGPRINRGNVIGHR